MEAQVFNGFGGFLLGFWVFLAGSELGDGESRAPRAPPWKRKAVYQNLLVAKMDQASGSSFLKSRDPELEGPKL